MRTKPAPVISPTEDFITFGLTTINTRATTTGTTKRTLSVRKPRMNPTPINAKTMNPAHVGPVVRAIMTSPFREQHRTEVNTQRDACHSESMSAIKPAFVGSNPHSWK